MVIRGVPTIDEPMVQISKDTVYGIFLILAQVILPFLLLGVVEVYTNEPTAMLTYLAVDEKIWDLVDVFGVWVCYDKGSWNVLGIIPR
ncbi:MAG: hypothetical protein LBU24_04580 [Methanocalculaceae archaeon]|jgi:hypothetical protein|nr:hypothetical protein [Methanocalculaceae archaeon]